MAARAGPRVLDQNVIGPTYSLPTSSNVAPNGSIPDRTA